MGYVLATFVVFGLVMAAMGIGVICNRRPLRGSCAGTGADTRGREAGALACACSAERDRCRMVVGSPPPGILRQARRQASGLVDIS